MKAKKPEELQQWQITMMVTASDREAIKRWLKAGGYTAGGYVASHLREVSRGSGSDSR